MLSRLLSLSSLLALTATGAAQTYTITDLGPIAPEVPFANSIANTLNNHGDVAGRSTTGPGDTFSTTLWLQTPKFGLPEGTNEITGLGFGNSRAYGMNDACQLTGFDTGPSGEFIPFLWDPVTGMLDLRTVGAGNGIGRRVNSAGHVVGEMESVTVFRDAFLYDGTQVHVLEPFDPIGLSSRAKDINELDQVCGFSTYSIDGNPDGSIRAALWLPEPAYGLPAGANDLDDISTVSQQISTARGINELGQVAVWGGRVNEFGLSELPFWLWLPAADYGLSAGMNHIGYAVAPGTCFANAINNRGEVVFRTDWDPTNPFGDFRATLWRQGEWIDLNTRISIADQQVWFLDAARDINEAGQISGTGFLNGEERAFLLTPVVENLPNLCTADIAGPTGTPDGTVDALDYLLMIGQWGSPCTGTCEADITGPTGTPDGNVDALDFLDLIGQWGDCPILSTGSCCFDLTGDCQQLSASDCAFMGGTFTPGADCNTTTCSTPIGACCLYPEDECSMLTEWACGLIDRAIWLGPDTDCSTAVCPIPGTGDRIEDPFIIDALPYARNANSSSGDNYYDEQCPNFSGAPDLVFAYTPTQNETITISLCRGSVYDTKLYVFENAEGNTVACNDDACTTPNFPDNPWVSAIDVLEVTAGNTYYIIVDGYGFESGFFTLDVDLIASGACCLPDETCFDASEQACIDAGGNWLSGDVCSSCPALPRGACCLPDSTCVANQLEFDCHNVWGGVWQGAGTSCFGANCP